MSGTEIHRRGRRSAAERRALKLWVVLSRAYAAIAARARDDIARHGLSVTEFGILEVLYHKGPLLLGDVQRRILLSSGGITYVADRLAEKGLIERRDCPTDRRARYAALTDDGAALMATIFPEHASSIAAAASGLTAREQEEVTRLVRTLGKSAAEPLPESAPTSVHLSLHRKP